MNLDFTLIVIDLPSHGKSEILSELSLDLYVEVIKGLVESLQIKKFILCGHSLGGAIAQSYYFKHPIEIISLILVSTGARLRVSPVILKLTKENFKEYLDSIRAGGFYRKTPKEIVDSFIQETSRMDNMVVHRDYSICDKFDVMEKISSINVPCLIICGNADKLTPLKYSKFFADNIKNSKLITINNTGHMVMLEKPDEFNQAIDDFIKNNLKL